MKITKPLIRRAISATLPVWAGYTVLGIGFGLLARAQGYPLWVPLAMSILIYGGSLQFAALSLFGTGAGLGTVFLTGLMVQARHLFYGISMLEPYRACGREKPYLIFSLTDETYSLVCQDRPEENAAARRGFFFAVSLLDQLYWVTGSLLGALLGSLLHFNTEGLDFALTALFLTIVTDQWRSTDRHMPALLGGGMSLFCLLIFGQDSFLIPSMLGITAGLLLLQPRKGGRHAS